MRKATSLLLLLVLNVAALTPVFGQKTRFNGKIKSVEQVQRTSFANVAGYSDGSGAWLVWSMGVEKNNLGFQVYRLVGKERELVRHGEFIKGSQPMYGDQAINDQVYDFFDEKGTSETLYMIVAITLGGEAVESAPFYPGYVSDLASLSGFRQRDPVSRNSTNGLLVTEDPIVEDKELKAEIESNQLVPDPVRHRTVISTPGSVKIGVRTDGPTRVTKTELQNAGFNVNTDPSTWQLFLQGNEQAITIGPNADYIEFLGKALDTIES
ncbi:MAG TPA: hypothetical protein VJL58_05650, partial [Pyrinomonadaceae bacterium]|nr:hypothetical protein [Pyrinomonadaceae bacterium]